MSLVYKYSSRLVLKQVNDEFVELEGLASTFGNLDRDGDIIVKGAFSKTLADGTIDIKLLNHHDLTQVLGRVDQAIETDDGLFIKARMPRENSTVKDLMPLLKMGALKDFSIGFTVVDSETTPDGNRIIKEVKLFEVSIVTIPANPKANITSVKKYNPIGLEQVKHLKTKRDFEQMLVNSKAFSRKAATTLVARFFNKNQSDSDLIKNEALKELQKLNKMFNGV